MQVRVRMLEEVRCRPLCQVQLSETDARTLGLHIADGYHHNWVLDGLPAANVAIMGGKSMRHFNGGFPIRFMDPTNNDAYVFNHVQILLHYRRLGEEYEIVHFSVHPVSVKHRFSDADFKIARNLNSLLK